MMPQRIYRRMSTILQEGPKDFKKVQAQVGLGLTAATLCHFIFCNSELTVLLGYLLHQSDNCTLFN